MQIVRTNNLLSKHTDEYSNLTANLERLDSNIASVRRRWPKRIPPLIYVDPVNGSDTNSGTEDSPLKTLRAAADLGTTDSVNVQIVNNASTPLDVSIDNIFQALHIWMHRSWYIWTINVNLHLDSTFVARAPRLQIQCDTLTIETNGGILIYNSVEFVDVKNIINNWESAVWMSAPLTLIGGSIRICPCTVTLLTDKNLFALSGCGSILFNGTVNLVDQYAIDNSLTPRAWAGIIANKVHDTSGTLINCKSNYALS